MPDPVAGGAGDDGVHTAHTRAREIPMPTIHPPCRRSRHRAPGAARTLSHCLSSFLCSSLSASPSAKRRASPLLPALLALVAAASSCSFTIRRFETGFDLEPGGALELRVLGARPYVEVFNEGPGEVDVVWSEGAVPERLARGTLARTLRGPVTVTVLAVGRERARLELVARRADGVDLRTLD